MSYEASLDFIDSPLGVIHVAASDEGVVVVMIGEDRAMEAESTLTHLGYRLKRGSNYCLAKAKAELRRYFEGSLHRFETPVRLHGTPFQLRVWETLCETPFGSVLTYSELADRVGRPRAARAVGTAMATNRVPILVPCHRVIASGGGLGGFTGGLEIKRSLLQLEGVNLDRRLRTGF